MVATNEPPRQQKKDAQLQMAANVIDSLKEEVSILRRKVDPPNVAQACLDIHEYLSTLRKEDKEVVLDTLYLWLKDGML